MPRSPRRDSTAAAISKVNDPKTDRSTLRWAARTLFDASEFYLAAIGFARLVDDDEPDFNALADLSQIAGEVGNRTVLLDVIERVLQTRGSTITLAIKLEFTRMHFDFTDTPDVETTRQLLEAIVESGPDAWAVVADADRIAKIETTLLTDATALLILEQLLYAPPTSGLPDNAVARLEALGCRYDATPTLARDVERLLHLVGSVDAAYRVESCRRIRQRVISTVPTVQSELLPSLAPLCITIAGGHPALRSLARRDLVGHGIAEVREIPSAWEAVRDGRAVAATVAGSDLIVIVASQIAHSTVDQVKDAADRFLLPVTYTHVATIGAIRRAVEKFAATTAP